MGIFGRRCGGEPAGYADGSTWDGAKAAACDALACAGHYGTWDGEPDRGAA